MDTTELQQTFQQFDRDGNGQIDFEEFCQLLSTLNAEMEEKSRQIGFDSIDTDHNGAIDFEEFANWWSDQD